MRVATTLAALATTAAATAARRGGTGRPAAPPVIVPARAAALAAVLALTLAWAGAAQAEFALSPGVLLSYECLDPEDAARPYAARDAATRSIARTLVPQVLGTLAVSPDQAQTIVAPGGYQQVANPSLQTRLPAATAEVDRVASAFAFVCRQDSVMVSDFDRRPADVGIVWIGFPAGTVTPALAQAFFLHAQATSPGLGGGYTAFGDRLLFVNLRDRAGRPYSELDDVAFVRDLATAAAAFTARPVRVLALGRTAAQLIDDRTESGAEGAHLARLGGETAPLVAALVALQPLRARILAQSRAAAGPAVSTVGPADRSE